MDGHFCLGYGCLGFSHAVNSMTRGVNGYFGCTTTSNMGTQIFRRNQNTTTLYLAYSLYARLSLHPGSLSFRLAMKGIKQSQSRMRVLGFNVWLHKYITYIIAGFFAGIAGC